MVVRLLALFTCIVVFACDSSDQSNPEQGASDSLREHVTDAELSQAKALSPAEAQVDSLVLRYAVGDVFRYRMRQESEAGPDSAFATQRSSHVYTKRVKAIRSDGSFELSVTVDSIEMSVVIRNRSSNAVLAQQYYNSSDTANRNDPKRIHLTAILGEEVSIILTPQGRIQEMSGVSTIVNKIRKVTPSLTTQDVPAVTQQIEAAVFAMLVEQEYLRFPSAALDSTATWVASNTVPVMDYFRASSDAKYTIRNVRQVRGQRLAVIDASLSGTITSMPLPKESAVSIKLSKGDIRGKGNVLIDVAKGFTVKKDNEITTSVAGMLTQTSTGMRQPLTQNTTMRYSVELLR